MSGLLVLKHIIVAGYFFASYTVARSWSGWAQLVSSLLGQWPAFYFVHVWQMYLKDDFEPT